MSSPSPNPSLRDDEVLERVGRLANRVAAVDADERALRYGRARMIQRIDGGGRARLQRPWVLVLAMFSAALITVVAWFAWPRSVVEYTVVGADVSEGGFVQASATEPARIAFDDGTVMELEPASRVRVGEQRARGASVHLEKGRVEVVVTPREGGADYVFEAGPYKVKVVGTAFVLAWDPDLGVARISMKEGVVSVLGPRIEDGFTLRAGQGIELSPGEIRVSAADSIAAPSSDSARQPRSAPSLEAAASPSGSGTPTVAPTTSARVLSWAERVAAGDHEEVLRDVDARGESVVLGSASVGDLMMLADAARYGGRPALANSALRAVRSRFAGTKSAASAAFLLGRIAEDGSRSKEAVSLYEAAIAEGSPFSGEALGRLMTIEHRLNKARAKELAERYLASHPNGAYADVAKTILGTRASTPKEI